MTGTGGYSWERYGLIVELTTQLQDISPQLGKTAMQKMVYILQAVYGISFGYDYRFYTYGPHSADLSGDLKIIEYHGGIEIRFVSSEARGYRIRQGANHSQFIEKAAGAIGRARQKMNLAIDEFGLYNARELELRSTIIYVHQDSRDNNTQHSRDDFVRLIHNLQPRFDLSCIETVIASLEMKGFIGSDQPS